MKQQVSCRIANSILTYVKQHRKSKESLLRDLDVSEEYLQDASSWISMELADILFHRVCLLFYDDEILYKIGRNSPKLGEWGVLDSVFRMLGDPKFIFHQSKKFISYFYKTIDLKVIEKSDFHVVIEFQNCHSSEGGNLKHARHIQYLQGALESIPTYWELGHAFSHELSWNRYEFRWENKQQFFGKSDAHVFLSPQLIQDTILQLEKTVSLIEKKNRQLQEKNEALSCAHAKLKETVKEKIQSEKMAAIGQLAAGVAHEVNNPLGFVMSNFSRVREYVDKLKDMVVFVKQKIPPESPLYQDFQNFLKEKEIDYVLEDFPKLLVESHEGLDRVHQIIKDLNQFSKKDVNHMALSNVHEGIDLTLNLLRHEVKDKIKIKKEYGNLPKIRCNLSRLNQVFLNLLMNAIQAIGDSGEIQIKTEHVKNTVKIYILDTGCGIDSVLLHKIFEPFFSTKTQSQNLGLGLSTAMSIVKQHGGDIEVQSKPGEGACFMLTLPMAGISD